MITSVILGAGFSYVAGLPLTKDLFNDFVIPSELSKKRKEKFKSVVDAWNYWKNKSNCNNAEIWLKELYKEDLPYFKYHTTFEDAIEVLSFRLAPIPKGKSSEYYYGITTSVDCPIHREFWTKLRKKYLVKNVISLNYDILAEQGLKKEYSSHRNIAPIFYYGGFTFPQVVRKMTNVTTGACEEIDLGKDITLYKLHGSLNWVNEPHSNSMKIHDDVRAVYRENSNLGRPLIVPPIEEKEVPESLSQVWKSAGRNLASSQIWFICGFSLPDYDKALRDLFQQSAKKTFSLQIVISDPNSEELIKKWEEITPKGTLFEALPGLPDLNNCFN